MMRFVKSGLGAAAVAGILAFGAGEAFAQGKEVVFGVQCDRTGPTATVGTVLCPG
jgi:branched-chain amino acid transport system substrate-binding protein